MGEVLPDGTLQGYTCTCQNCGEESQCNLQGQGTCPQCGCPVDRPIREWNFPETSGRVDLRRLYEELCDHEDSQSYVDELQREAPYVASRLRRWAKQQDVLRFIQWSKP